MFPNIDQLIELMDKYTTKSSKDEMGEQDAAGGAAAAHAADPDRRLSLRPCANC